MIRSMQKMPVARRLAIAFGVAGMSALVGGLGLLIEQMARVEGDRTGMVVAAGGFALAALASMVGAWMARRHFAGLERFRASVLALTADESLTAPPPPPRRAGPEVAALHGAFETYVAHRKEQTAAVDRRLAQILSALGDAIIVVTAEGQVTLVNHEAMDLLGTDRVAVGTSVFAALKAGPAGRAIEAALSAETTVHSELATNEDQLLKAEVTPLGDGGVVISIPHEATEAQHHFDHDLFLLDTVPEPPPVLPDTPLANLPVFVLDCETTGLDVKADSIVAVGGVRLHGPRIYRTANIDRLVNPGRPIPAESTEIHGIDDRMMRGAPRFRAIWPELRQLMAGCVLVGHHVAFDLAHLKRTMDEEGLRWTPPETLDTMLLAAALEGRESTISLDELAARYNIAVHGRHTALGDALVTAEVYARLLPLLEDQGVETLRDALLFQRRAYQLIALEQQAGWHDL